MASSLRGTIERITFYDDDSGYTVARFLPEGAAQVVTAVGNLLGASVGEALALEGLWTHHPQHGRQFEIQHFSLELPATVEGLRKYLGSGLIKGIGPATAERIVAHFGLETFDVIEQSVERLLEVAGVGPKRMGVIQRGWAEHQQIKEVMLFLQGHGVSTSLAVKIYKAYGDGALHVVQQDPYRLARDIYGIGFVTANKIAEALGVAPDDPSRLEAGVRHVLGQASGDEGHVFLPQADLLREAAALLGVEAPLLDAAIERLAQGEEVVVEEAAVYLIPFYRAEVGVARRLRPLQQSPTRRLAVWRSVDWEKAFAWLRTRSQIALTAQQQAAVQTALTAKVSILTGGPGTGKTTTLRGLIQLLKVKGGTFHLAAPTGRAAKRLSEATGEPAQTLHRLLGFKSYGGQKFMHDADHPLDADLIIVDEVSMVDLLLMNALLKAVDPGSHLLLVGDPDQLPAVGAGNVLRDLIASQAVPLVALEVIFRQAQESLIVTNAHRINRGESPRFSSTAQDFFLFVEREPEQAAARVVELVATRIPQRFGLDPVVDIQVLSPMHRGRAGVGALNMALQEALNPPGAGTPEWRHGSRIFRVGDKVLQTRNNYTKEVFNGDMGRIVALDRVEQLVQVDFEGEKKEYEFSELDELVHAFAVSVHKAQGSEYRAVVLPVLTEHYMMLQRNLLYTAITRARELVVLVGTQKAIGMAVRNQRIAHRHTRLAERVRSG